MIKLSQKASEFLNLCIKAAQESKNQEFTFGNNIPFKLVIDAQGDYRIFFSIRDNHNFCLSMIKSDNAIIPYFIYDADFTGFEELKGIQEPDFEILSPREQWHLLAYVVKSMFDAIVNSLITYTENPEDYKGELEEASFKSIRLIYHLLMRNMSKYCSWAIEDCLLGSHSVSFKVTAFNFNGRVKIEYNPENYLYNVTFINSDMLSVAGRTGIKFYELINYIERKIDIATEQIF